MQRQDLCRLLQPFLRRVACRSASRSSVDFPFLTTTDSIACGTSDRSYGPSRQRTHCQKRLRLFACGVKVSMSSTSRFELGWHVPSIATGSRIPCRSLVAGCRKASDIAHNRRCKAAGNSQSCLRAGSSFVQSLLQTFLDLVKAHHASGSLHRGISLWLPCRCRCFRLRLRLLLHHTLHDFRGSSIREFKFLAVCQFRSHCHLIRFPCASKRITAPPEAGELAPGTSRSLLWSESCSEAMAPFVAFASCSVAFFRSSSWFDAQPLRIISSAFSSAAVCSIPLDVGPDRRRIYSARQVLSS